MTTSYFQPNASEFLISDKVNARPGEKVEYPRQAEMELEFISAREWDDIASEFADIIPEQMGSFNVGHWGEENLEFAVVNDRGVLIGGAAIIVKSIPVINTGIAILKWGPLCQKTGEEFDVEVYNKIINCLKDEYCFNRNFHLTVMPCAKPEVAKICESSLVGMGFNLGDGLAAPERYIVNVADDSETLKSNLDQKWRYNMRKAFKNEFDINIVDPNDGLGEFLDLYAQMIERKKFLDSSAIDALEKIITDSPANTRPIIVLVSHAGSVTAGGIFHVSGNMASYMFGATDERALKLKAGYAMHWWVAEYLCDKEHIEWYDLGGNDLDQGLHQFKKGFVGKSGQILSAPPRYHLSNSMSSSLAGFAAFRVRDFVSTVKRFFHNFKKTH